MATTTLRVLREEVARGLGIRSFVKGTVPTTGTASILPDGSRLEPDGEWSDVDTFVLFTSGALDGVTRRVTGFSTGLSLQVSPALASAVASGATYQVFKTFPPEDFTVAINDGLRELGMRRVTSVGTTAEVTDDRRLAVPSLIGNTATEIVGVERSVGTTNSPWNYEVLIQGKDYDLVRSGAATWLELAYAPVTGTIVRFTYTHEATTLTADTDSTSEPALLVKALARKYLAISNRDEAGVEFWGRESERIRKDVIPITQRSRKTIIPNIRVY